MAKTSKSKCSHPRAARYYNNISEGNTQNGYACDLCGLEGLSAPQDPQILAPGVYKLLEPVKNAGKDGRSSDWESKSEFAPGTYYVVPNRFRDGYGCTVEKCGYRRVEPDHHGYDALVAALVPSEGRTGEFLTLQAKLPGQSFSADPEEILGQLIDSGKISRADVLAAIAENNAKEEEDN